MTFLREMSFFFVTICLFRVFRNALKIGLEMIHPHTEVKYISDVKGYGVVAKQFIPKGTVTWVLDDLDREFKPDEIEHLDPVYQQILDTYTFRNSAGNHVLCWDHGRYVNHSFNSNCLTTAYDFEIAIRDIYPGEELTDDYGYLNIGSPFRALDEGTRRKTVYPDDLKRYYKVWDRKLWSAFKRIGKVSQPLHHLIREAQWQYYLDVAMGKEPMESILACYFPGSENGAMVPVQNGHSNHAV